MTGLISCEDQRAWLMLRFCPHVTRPSDVKGTAGPTPSASRPGKDQEASAVAARSGRSLVRTRAIAVLSAIAAGISWLATSGTASAQQSPIQHIVVLYLENHSFDNLLGFWCNDHPRRCPDGGMPTLVK